MDLTFLRKEREEERETERDRRCHYDERICMRKEVTCGCKDKVKVHVGGIRYICINVPLEVY